MGFKIIARTGSVEGIEDEFLAIDARVVRSPIKTEEDIIAAASDADAVIVGAVEPYTEKVIGTLTKCKVISRAGIGCNNIDLDAATKYGIPVAFVPDASVSEVSDHAMALLLTLSRKIMPLDQIVKKGFWQTGRGEVNKIRKPIFRLEKQTLGLVGIGRIGASVARKAKIFGMRILAYDPYAPAEMIKQLEVQMVDLDTILKESDFISLHTPVTKDTLHLFNTEQFNKMKPTAYIINTSRGGLIDEAALLAALSENRIAGAGLDVVDPEPPKPDNPLLKLENVIITAHTAYYSEDSDLELRHRTAEAVIDALQGNWPSVIANTAVKNMNNRRIK